MGYGDIDDATCFVVRLLERLVAQICLAKSFQLSNVHKHPVFEKPDQFALRRSWGGGVKRARGLVT